MIAQLLNTFAASSSYNYSYSSSSSSTAGGGALAAIWVGYLIVVVVMIVAMWKVFAKAGRPGWAAIIPVYNTWVLFEIVGMPGWYALLALVPIVNFVAVVFLIIAYFKLAKAFGKGTGFGVATIFFPFVTFPILAFGDAKYDAAAIGGTSAPQAGAPQPVAPVAPVDPGQQPPVAPVQ